MILTFLFLASFKAPRSHPGNETPTHLSKSLESLLGPFKALLGPFLTPRIRVPALARQARPQGQQRYNLRYHNKCQVFVKRAEKA